MFAVDIEGMPRRVFDVESVVIGRSTRSDLVLPDRDVSRHHADLEWSDGVFVLVDAGSTHGTYVDRRLVERVEVKRGSRIQIGPFVLAIEPDAAPDDTEDRLLDAIARDRDDTARLVYADWLEERGDHARAEFLRLQEQLAGDPTAPGASHRLREVAASIEMTWRHRVARTLVEGCDMRFSFKCPREWSSMSLTTAPAVRHCDTCHKHVYYAATMGEAQHHAELGHCVAVDIIPLRRPGDLAQQERYPGPPPTAGMPAPPPGWNERSRR